MAENIANPRSPSRYQHHYLPDNRGVESYLPIYSRRIRSPEQPIPLPPPVQRNRIIEYDAEQINQSINEFRRRGYIPLPELTFDWVDFIARHLYGRSNNFVRAFMKRYIITDPLISRSQEQRLRQYLLDILRRVATRESLEEAIQFLRDIWETHISLDPSDPDTYELLVLFLDTEAIHRMVENSVEYNQRGVVKISPSRRRRRMSSRSVRGVGIRSRRRRRQMSVSPPIYDGGRHRRTMRRKK
uniref:Uncharacterized protein n=1 Tax=viral metagenome TaxID=1070528 RepID=A0A6C0F2K3_9ZZZZ